MLELISQYFASLFPEGVHPFDMFPTLAFIIVVVIVLAVLIRAIADKASKYNHALASAMAILFFYILAMLFHKIWPEPSQELLDILPLIDFDGKTVSLYQFAWTDIKGLFREFLYAYILSIIVIGLDDLIPDAKNGFAWIVLQTVILFFAMVLYWLVINTIDHFLPGILNSHAPLILGCFILTMVFLGILKLILGLLLVAIDPLLGAVAVFFKSNPFGQAMGKAALCTLVMFAVTVCMQVNGIDSFTLADLNLAVCAMPMLVLLVLWLAVGFIFL